MRKKKFKLFVLSLFVFSVFLIIIIQNIPIQSTQSELVSTSYSWLQIGDPPWGDGDPPWGDGDPPWGDGAPPGPPPDGYFNGTGFPSGMPRPKPPGMSETTDNNSIWINITVTLGIFASLFAFFITRRAVKRRENLRVINQLGKRHMIPKDKDEFEVYREWGHKHLRGVPDWAYQIILKREKASNYKTTRGKIAYKHLPKEVKKERVVFCEYEKEGSHCYLKGYKMNNYDFKIGKMALNDIHNKIKIKHNLFKNKNRRYRMQMDEWEQEKQGDTDLDILKILLNQND